MEMNISRYRTLAALRDRLAKCQAEVLQVYKAEGMGMQNMTLAQLAEKTAKDYAEATVPDKAPVAKEPVKDAEVEKQVDAMVAEAMQAANATQSGVPQGAAAHSAAS